MAQQAARVAVEKTTPQYDKEYDYLVPEGLCVQPGQRVTVPFGRGDKRRVAIVLETLEVETPGRLKTITSVVDEAPVLGEEQMGLLRYLKEQTFCSWFDALKVLIPAGYGMLLDDGYALDSGNLPEDEASLSPEERQVVDYLRRKKKTVSGQAITKALGLVDNHPALRSLAEKGIVVQSTYDKRKIQDERILMVRMSDAYIDVELPRLTAKQAEVCRVLGDVGTASLKEVCYFCGLTRAVVDRLEQQGIVTYYEQQVYRNPYAGVRVTETADIALTQGQQVAYEKLLRQMQTGTYGVSLLYGVTGSGKTQVFLKLISQVVAAGKKVIVMVPEISLTPQTIEMFHRTFGGRTAVLHSSLTMSQRLDEWRRIREGGADIVVGTRSAVFAPLEDIGLIVMDEEQERTYKSESAPRFHAREVAKLRCRYHGATLLLSSATPSIESYYNAQKGRYQLVTLDARYAGAKLPDVYMVDLRDEPAQAGTSAISTRLSEELYHNLRAGEQSILLLNRRGYNTVVKCSSCGEVVECPNCSVALTYHSANGRLLCHYCGHSQEIPKACQNCGSQMVRYSGVGTQRVEEELRTIFPDARILRMDMDTTMSRYSYEKNFGAFAAGEYDIMVGTQMVAKGLNFPKVTLVGVLSADLSLYADDFRSFERTFSLLTQVVGRSGRAELPGRAFVQTFSPENRVLALAATQDYDAFYGEEIQFRQVGIYPPYCDMVAVGFVALDEQKLGRSARGFFATFKKLAEEKCPDMPLRLLGPSPAGLYRVAGKYRMKLLIKCRNNSAFRALLGEALDTYYKNSENKEVTAFVDTYYDATI